MNIMRSPSRLKATWKHKSRLAFIAAALAMVPIHAVAHDPRDDLLPSLVELQEIRIGASEKEIAEKLEPLWFARDACDFIQEYPYNNLVPYTNVAVMTAWQAKVRSWDRQLVILFAIFSDSNKTNLVDALLHDESGISAEVEGLYDKNVKSVAVGDSMRQVFTLVGRRACEYFQDGRGNWRVKCTYTMSTGEGRLFEADAGSGKVLKVTVLHKL
ncbi:MAG TPA: hypothetical protein VN673_06055 [Clostridia bacterium]|nr:hypothetical protein [Clostridia bacterium]